ncbi:HSF-type DNA-binding-domain-containing protein [Sporodiniella umbellata]|nr:HSF-type DNA-binding-domain-containing protein [Sporodiniella umbellata]
MDFQTKRKRSDVSDTSIKATGQKNVPAFLSKLYNMVDDKSTDILIRWSRDGKSFLVEKHEEFAKTILPRFYKHNTFASFVRQLNMYDFHKIPHIQQGVMISEHEHQIWEFSHPHFQKQRSDLLVLVTRKKNKEKETESEPTLHNLADDLLLAKENQTHIQSQLISLHQDNEILWQETLASRDKHQGHQEAIEKILLFLTSVFPNPPLPSKNLIQEAASLAGVCLDPSANKKITLNRFAHTLDTATRSAQSITQEIDQLQVNIETLANNIGVDPSQCDIDLDLSQKQLKYRPALSLYPPVSPDYPPPHFIYTHPNHSHPSPMPQNTAYLNRHPHPMPTFFHPPDNCHRKT